MVSVLRWPHLFPGAAKAGVRLRSDGLPIPDALSTVRSGTAQRPDCMSRGLFPTVPMNDLARHVLPWASVSQSIKEEAPQGHPPVLSGSGRWPRGPSSKSRVTTQEQLFCPWGSPPGRRLLTRTLCGLIDGAGTPGAASGSLAEGTPGNILLIFTVKMILLLLFSIIIITLTELHGNKDKYHGILGADHLNSWFIGEESEPQRGTGLAKFIQSGCDLVQGPSSRPAPHCKHLCTRMAQSQVLYGSCLNIQSPGPNSRPRESDSRGGVWGYACEQVPRWPVPVVSLS